MAFSLFLDKVTGKCYTYTYDTYENVTEEQIDGVAFKTYEHDEHNRLTSTTVKVGDGTHVYRPIYDTNANGKIYAENTVIGVELEDVFTARAEHDDLGRVVEKTLTLNGAENPLISESISYLSVVSGTNTRLTNMVESFTNKVNGVEVDKLTYVYDNNGNITEIKRDGEVLIQYAYDGLNQLLREDNAILGKITTFTYDTAGNITEKKILNRTALGVGVLEQTIPYTYATTGWKDRLTSYNGESIVYDALGNPTTYRGHSLTWGKIKQLEVFDTNTFAYNAEGIRVRKNNITYELDGTKILREVRGASVIEYFYDADAIVGFRYNNVDYYYQKNQQGDIVAVYTASGTKVAEYVYDAWGKCTVLLDTDNIGTINPFRYRSYYFDTETGLYYLQTRYYDPEVGRFINADNLVSTGQGILGHNMFAYCGNSPISRADQTGNFWISALIATAVAVLCTVGLSSCSKQYSSVWDAPDLDYLSDYPESFNCFGLAINKKIFINIPGYHPGDSVEETFQYLIAEIGQENIRRLDSIDDKIFSDEYRVAMRCGPTDFHFIREINGAWYNKSGEYGGFWVPIEYVTGDLWISKGIDIWNGHLVEFPETYYDSEIIYFAIKKGWNKDV